MARDAALVVDVSVFADYYLLYPRRRERHERARGLLDALLAAGPARL